MVHKAQLHSRKLTEPENDASQKLLIYSKSIYTPENERLVPTISIS